MAAHEHPVIDVSPLVRGGTADDRRAVGRAIDAACRDDGFFSIVGHGIDLDLLARLEVLGREFFSLDPEEKEEIAMVRGGRAWRGWFPVGGELTSGTPDRKEGLYFGEELPRGDPRVVAGLPLHGPNLFPERPAALRGTVLACLDAFTKLGHQLMLGFALALELDEVWFERELTTDPVILFRMFHYPALPEDVADPLGWGVGEHTDYGLLTLLYQDAGGGLEVRDREGWGEIPPRPDALVCNLGDMLERMTGGVYRSTPHRVRSPRGRDRIACPFFFDPGWDAEVRAITAPEDRRRSPEVEDRRRAADGRGPAVARRGSSGVEDRRRAADGRGPAVALRGSSGVEDRRRAADGRGPAVALRGSSGAEGRWDGTSVFDFDGTYGDYLLGKVSKVFPELRDQALE